jgi:hypothetical protein
MINKPSLLSQIKSKYILQNVLILAYPDIKSVFKLVKYNKNLLNKLDISIKDCYNYKIEKFVYKASDKFQYILLLKCLEFTFLLLPFVFILLDERGTPYIQNLKKGYDIQKKKYIDFIDNYIILSYLGFFIISSIIDALLIFHKKIYVNYKTKLIFSLFQFFVFLSYYISYLIKFTYYVNLMEGQKKEDRKKYSFCDLYLYDIIHIVFVLILFVGYLIYFIRDKFRDDGKQIDLKQINGINIISFNLPEEFDNYNNKSKNEFIFKKENIENYKYDLNGNQINLINNINDIRKNNNIPELKFDKYEKLQDFIIYQRTELIFHKNQNINKIPNNLYIFRYNINELQNLLNNKEILNIIKIDFLDTINIIIQNNMELVSVYNISKINDNIYRANNINNNILNINIKNNRINTRIDNINTVINLEDKAISLSNNEIDNGDESEIRNIK